MPERIRALDPGFRLQTFAAEAERAWQAGERRRLASLMPRGAEDARQAAQDTAAMLETLPYLALAATPDFVVGKVGHPEPAELARGEALRTVLSIVAIHGAQGDEAAQQAAYRAGMDSLAGAAAPALLSPPNWPVALEAALGKLARLDALAKRRVVAALTATVAHDGRLTLGEAELLRTLCAILRCPLPPLMPEVVAVPSAASAAPPAT